MIFTVSDQDWLESIIFRELVDEDDDDNTVKWENYCGDYNSTIFINTTWHRF